MLFTDKDDFVKDLQQIIDTCSKNETDSEIESEIIQDIISQCNDIIASVELDYPPEAIDQQFKTLNVIIAELSEVRRRN